MRRTDFCRREQSDLTLETKSPQVTPDAFGPTRREHAADVLDEDEPGPSLNDDPAGWAPQVALVVQSEPLSGEAVRLARDAANEAIHKSAPRSAIEGSGIRPHR